jgi:dihydropteroate synthase
MRERVETRHWNFLDSRYELSRIPLLMGIVNVTPDSFSDGGDHFDSDAAVQHAMQLADEGADILDIGGESTRPGADLVPLHEELRRVIPVVKRVASETEVPVSIDTTKAEVARRAIDAGAIIVNDISGLTFDDDMPTVCRETGVGVICMHIRGTPQTMQNDLQYGNVVEEIREFFERRLDVLEEAGVPRERVVLDPGIGFGKTAEQNIEILSNIQRFRSLNRPVLIGHSRKRFLTKVLGRAVDERTQGTLGITVALAAQCTDIIRVHDVAANRDALLAWDAIANRTKGSRVSPTRG